jgi:Family of unknown function (DUF5899)
MEYLIGAAIVALGYGLSNSRKKAPPITASASSTSPTQQAQQRDIAVNRAASYPFPQEPQSSTALLKQQEDESQKRWDDAITPATSGIINSRLVPFYRSMKSQNNNPKISQYLMERNTGLLDSSYSVTGTWKPKRETTPFFQPTPQPVMSTGQSGNPITYSKELETARVSGVQNNVLPFAQQRIGPGVGVDATVAAAGGFHYGTYRVNPIDAWGYKLNHLEGRIVPGAAINSARSPEAVFYQHGVPRFYTQERYPMERGRATLTASTARSTIVQPCWGQDKISEEYFGIAGVSGPNTTPGKESRNKGSLPGMPVTNLKNVQAMSGGFVNRHDPTRSQLQRRENGTMLAGGVTGHASSAEATYSQSMYDSTPTNRSLCEPSKCEHYGAAGSVVPTGTKQYDDEQRRTIREVTELRTNGFAAANPVIHAPTVECTKLQLLKASKRGSQVVNTHIAGPERNDVFREARLGDDIKAPTTRCFVPAQAVKDDNHRNSIVSHAASSTMYYNEAYPGEIQKQEPKIPVQNKFLDLTIAKSQLQNNDLKVTIN